MDFLHFDDRLAVSELLLCCLRALFQDDHVLCQTHSRIEQIVQPEQQRLDSGLLMTYLEMLPCIQ